MKNSKTFLAIIPARGGSKRLPRKNILDLDGKPLITYTIEAALKSKYIDNVIVTSDDGEILKIAEKNKVNTILRPDSLSSDTASTFDAVEHTIMNSCIEYDYIVLLQPTSPLRTAIHIDEAIELLEKKGADSVVSVCEMEHSPLWSNKLDNTLSLEGFLKDEVINKRSQDLETYFRLNGALYICKRERLLNEKSFFFKNNIFAYKMSVETSIDIDNKIDFEMATFFKRALKHEKI